MRIATMLVTVVCMTAGSSAWAETASHPGAKPHDVAALMDRQGAVPQARDTLAAPGVTRLAACDTIFCPGYALIGVGF